MPKAAMKAFESFVGDHQAMVYQYALALVGQHHLAEDVAQEDGLWLGAHIV